MRDQALYQVLNQIYSKNADKRRSTIHGETDQRNATFAACYSKKKTETKDGTQGIENTTGKETTRLRVGVVILSKCDGCSARCGSFNPS
jgi:hypothetical protein